LNIRVEELELIEVAIVNPSVLLLCGAENRDQFVGGS
jgi:hypothetical protein